MLVRGRSWPLGKEAHRAPRPGPALGRQGSLMLTPDEEADLRDLSWHWEGAYGFKVTDGVWSATPLANPSAVLTAESAHELRELVRRDYGERQVSLAAVRGERMST